MKLLKALLLTFIFAIAAQAQTLTAYTANLAHGQGTDGQFNFQRQVGRLVSADLIAVQERSTTETGWNSPRSAAGIGEAICLQNSSIADDTCIWHKTATVTVDATYTRALNTGTNPSCGTPNVGWDCSTDVRKSAVAVKATVSGRQFYFVSVHLCWSRCADSNGSQFSVQRVNQATDLLNWIAATLTGGLPIIIAGDMNFTPTHPKNPSGFQIDLFTSAGYSDSWQVGIAAGTATASWGDRDGDSVPDMPVGSLTTRTADTRRIDYVFFKGTGLTLTATEVPDSRATCSAALTNIHGNQCANCTSTFKECPDVTAPSKVWDVPDDQGVRASDHNFVKTTFNLGGHLVCRFHTPVTCQ